MKEEALLTTRIRNSISLILNNNEGLIDFYLFGSALWKNNPGDIDILLVYDNTIIPIERVISIKSSIKSVIETVFQKPLHVTMLSRLEEEETQFRQKVEAVQL